MFRRQAVFVGIYDGCVIFLNHKWRSLTLYSHGGSTVSQYLRQELHGLFESVDKRNIPELYLWIKEIGGYFKRFKGGALAPWIHEPVNKDVLSLEARATQAFFEVGPIAVRITRAHSLPDRQESGWRRSSTELWCDRVCCYPPFFGCSGNALFLR